MPLGRYMRDFDIAYLEALRSAYPGADADELSKLTYRSPSTIARWMRGEYSHLEGDVPPCGGDTGFCGVRTPESRESALKSRMSALEEKLYEIDGRLRDMERGTRMI